jgi:hypothetical protein
MLAEVLARSRSTALMSKPLRAESHRTVARAGDHDQG